MFLEKIVVKHMEFFFSFFKQSVLYSENILQCATSSAQSEYFKRVVGKALINERSLKERFWTLMFVNFWQRATCYVFNLVNNGLCNLCCLKAEQCCLQYLANRTNYQQRRRREKEEETKKCPKSDFRETLISSTGEIRSLV